MRCCRLCLHTLVAARSAPCMKKSNKERVCTSTIMPENNLSIAVIGGGASAILFLAQAMRRKPANLNLTMTIFDRSGNFAKGIAYGTQRREHLLNVNTENMSGVAEDPLHFFHWLKENSHTYGPTDFAPRVVYGEYLENLL